MINSSIFSLLFFHVGLGCAHKIKLELMHGFRNFDENENVVIEIN